MLRNTETEYGSGMKFFHTLVIILIILQAPIGLLLNFLSHSMPAYFYTFHKSLGTVILVGVILFILWRFINPKPAWPLQMPQWERVAARTNHTLLYLCLLVMPLSGWIMSTAAGKSPRFFWITPLPFPGIPKDKYLANLMLNIHNITAWILIALVVLHILAALKHYFWDKDNILQRMF